MNESYSGRYFTHKLVRLKIQSIVNLIILNSDQCRDKKLKVYE